MITPLKAHVRQLKQLRSEEVEKYGTLSRQMAFALRHNDQYAAKAYRKANTKSRAVAARIRALEVAIEQVEKALRANGT